MKFWEFFLEQTRRENPGLPARNMGPSAMNSQVFPAARRIRGNQFFGSNTPSWIDKGSVITDFIPKFPALNSNPGDLTSYLKDVASNLNDVDSIPSDVDSYLNDVDSIPSDVDSIPSDHQSFIQY